MRPGQQNRRGRGRNNNNRKPQNPLARSFESNGPDVKVRGTPAHIAEKYMSLARDAQSAGDPVRAENYLQHAEHYYRVMAATMPRERLLAQQNGEGGFQQGQQQNGEGGNVQPVEGGMQGGDTPDAMKVMDDNAGDDVDGDDEVEADAGEADREQQQVEASANQDQQDEQGQEGGGRGRRRRGRRRHNDGDRPTGGGNGGGGGDTEARSALDSLARKQGALTGG